MSRQFIHKKHFKNINNNFHKATKHLKAWWWSNKKQSIDVHLKACWKSYILTTYLQMVTEVQKYSFYKAYKPLQLKLTLKWHVCVAKYAVSNNQILFYLIGL